MAKQQKDLKRERIKHFQAEVTRYMELFGLGRWSYKFIEWDEENAADAQAYHNIFDRWATFSINPTKAAEKSDRWASRCALHEVTHVLISRLASMVKWRTFDQDMWDEEQEAIAKSLERAFFGPVDD